MIEKYADDTAVVRFISNDDDIIDIPTLLERFGEYFISHVSGLGYEKLLRALGNDLKSFLESLDFLHYVHLKASFTEMNAPSFRCMELEDGTLLLHYYSSREGLEPIVSGMVKAVARTFFDVKVDIQYLEKREPPLGRKTYSTFLIKAVGDNNFQKSLCKKSSPKKFVLGGDAPDIPRPLSSWSLRNFFEPPDRLWVDEESFCHAFPFHMVFDKELHIKQCGVMIQRVCRNLTLNDSLVSEYFEITHPTVPFTSSNIRQFVNMDFFLKTKQAKVTEYYKHRAALLIRGQMTWMNDLQCIMFLGSPFVNSLEDMKRCGLHFSDLAAHDLTRDLVLSNQQRMLELDLAKQLEQKKEELHHALKQLKEEQKKTDSLLYSMMPRTAANLLREGKEVGADFFQEVTVLFSDIVKFTNICGKCKPIEVIHLLNDMYLRFDSLTTIYDVYKVETIGDAYMVTAGLPLPTADHAERVANFALDIITASNQVKSPVDNNPIKIRVGIHSGTVVSGVVGKKVPRYSLFGDTVNVASRMESHGLPGRIHISRKTHDLLDNERYVTEERGEIEVKGKGPMKTYFLNGKRGEQKLDSVDDNPNNREESTSDMPIKIINTDMSQDSLSAKKGDDFSSAILHPNCTHNPRFKTPDGSPSTERKPRVDQTEVVIETRSNDSLSLTPFLSPLANNEVLLRNVHEGGCTYSKLCSIL
ncbi:guanylate cyclase soluble subunit beta-2-like [Glandiceps talaboti]